MWRRQIAALMLILLLGGAQAWAQEPPPVLVSSIVLSVPDEAAVRVDETLQILADVQPEGAGDRTLEWSVSDERIATVDEQGRVKGVKPGLVTVRADARDGGGAYGTIEIEVLPVLVEEIALSLTGKSLCYGAEWPIEAEVSPENATDPSLEWSSSDPAVVSVVRDELGNPWLRAGRAPGTAVVTATAADGGGASADCAVRVMTPVTDILINVPGDADTILKGGAIELTTEVLPSDASDELKWVNGDERVAALEPDGGRAVLTGVGGGEVTLTALAQDGSGRSASVNLSVRVPIEALSLPEAASVFVGRGGQLEAVLSPEDTTDRVLRWESDAPSVATVDKQGIVTGVSVGMARITARAAADLLVMDVCEVTVTKPVTSILLSSEASVIGLGGSMRVTAAVSPADANDRSVRWVSNNPSIASVDVQGVVTGLAVGSTVIQAVARDGSGVSGALAVEVQSQLKSIGLPSAVSILPDEQVRLTLTTKPLGLDPGTITWKSANPSVAAVDASGLVTGIGLGETVVTATGAGGLSAQCVIRVSIELSTIEIQEPGGAGLADEIYEINLGETRQLYARARPAGIPVQFEWRSDNAKVASVTQDGLVGAVKPGTAALTVTARSAGGDQKVSRRVTVKVIQPVMSVMLPETVRVLAGSAQTVNAVLSPAKATYTALAWATGDQGVATVDARGVVRGIAPGSTLLTATSHNRMVGVSRVEVALPARSVTIARSTTGSVYPNDQLWLTAEVLPAGADQSVTWKSGNTSIAKVSASGLVTARRAGTVKITATAADGSGAKTAVKLKIETPVKQIKLNKKTLTLYVNGEGAKLPQSVPLKIKILPKSAQKSPVAWTSNDPGVAAVDASGRVTAVKDGVAIVAASTENGCRAQAVVWVKTLPTYITLARERAVLQVKEQLPLGEAAAMDGTEDRLAWTSSKPGVAKVSGEGVVTALKPGKATITVKTKNGLAAKCIIEVVAKAPQPPAGPEPEPGTEEPEPEPGPETPQSESDG